MSSNCVRRADSGPACFLIGQAKLDALDRGQRFVTSSWHTWEDPEEGGAAKPSLVL